jgi:ribosome-binding protein aMBF1 (putative translation factor)
MPTIAQARRRKSLTQKQLATKIGIEPALVAAWEEGISKPQSSNLKKLGEILEISSEEIEFVSASEKPKTSPKTSNEVMRQEVEAHNESMGYVDSTWLRGGRYDIDPASHDTSI